MKSLVYGLTIRHFLLHPHYRNPSIGFKLGVFFRVAFDMEFMWI
jgi:hypothetical protein